MKPIIISYLENRNLLSKKLKYLKLFYDNNIILFSSDMNLPIKIKIIITKLQRKLYLFFKSKKLKNSFKFINHKTIKSYKD